VTEHLALREQAKARDGAKFDLKKYNDTVMSFAAAREVRPRDDGAVAAWL